MGPRLRGDERMVQPIYGSSRTGSPAAAIAALASPMLISPKWKIEAASTASAAVGIPATMMAGLARAAASNHRHADRRGHRS